MKHDDELPVDQENFQSTFIQLIRPSFEISNFAVQKLKIDTFMV